MVLYSTRNLFVFKNMRQLFTLLLTFFSLFHSLQAEEKTFHYYCTVADEVHYPLLLNLIGSIHKADFDHLDEIAVFDIGLTAEQRAKINQIEKTKVYDVEMIHPDLCTYFVTHPSGKRVRGWYAWKAVVMKQALDMYPYMLYIDAGSLVLSSPDNLFKHIQQNGYFLMHIAPHNIADRITQSVLNKIIAPLPSDEQLRILSPNCYMVVSGVQGVSRDIYQSYLEPIYRCSFDLSNYMDDGSAKLGFGQGRHDQVLFSIYANLLNLKIEPQSCAQLLVDGVYMPFHYQYDRPDVSQEICILSCRWDGTLSADKQNYIRWKTKKLRFFNLDLHIAVIGDVKNIFESLGHEVVDWSLSGHSWVFGKPRETVDIVNENTWLDMNQWMCDAFYERYKDFLQTFDGFIVTYPPAFSLLYEKLNKPIIIVNAIRYEHPFILTPDRCNWLNEYLKNGVKNKKIFIVSNNKGDQQYLKHYTGIESEHIPSLCLYTNAKYTGKKDGYLFRCPFIDVLGRAFSNKELIQNKQVPIPHQWQELYDFKGIVHFPFQTGSMSISEQYSANVPLFFPTKRFLSTLRAIYPKNILDQLTFYTHFKVEPPNIPGDLNNINDPEVLKFWIDAADYYDEENMPYIQYFDSFDQLEELLQTVDGQAISHKMSEYNKLRKERAIEKWKIVLKQVQDFDEAYSQKSNGTNL